MHEIERRAFSGELRAEGENVLVGIVVPYGNVSKIGERFTEKWLPGSVGTIGPEVRCNLHHDRASPLAVNLPDGGLSFTDSATELRARIELPRTQIGLDTALLVKRHVLTGLSAEFRCLKDTWSGRARTITSVELLGLAVVDRPGLRGAAVEIEGRWAEIGGDDDEQELPAYRRRLLRWV